MARRTECQISRPATPGASPGARPECSHSRLWASQWRRGARRQDELQPVGGAPDAWRTGHNTQAEVAHAHEECYCHALGQTACAPRHTPWPGARGGTLLCSGAEELQTRPWSSHIAGRRPHSHTHTHTRTAKHGGAHQLCIWWCAPFVPGCGGRAGWGAPSRRGGRVCHAGRILLRPRRSRMPTQTQNNQTCRKRLQSDWISSTRRRDSTHGDEVTRFGALRIRHRL